MVFSGMAGNTAPQHNQPPPVQRDPQFVNYLVNEVYPFYVKFSNIRKTVDLLFNTASNEFTIMYNGIITYLEQTTYEQNIPIQSAQYNILSNWNQQWLDHVINGVACAVAYDMLAVTQINAIRNREYDIAIAVAVFIESNPVILNCMSFVSKYIKPDNGVISLTDLQVKYNINIHAQPMNTTNNGVGVPLTPNVQNTSIHHTHIPPTPNVEQPVRQVDPNPPIKQTQPIESELYKPKLVEIDTRQIIGDDGVVAYASNTSDYLYRCVLCDKVPFRAFNYRHCNHTTISYNDVVSLVNYAKIINTLPVDEKLIHRLVDVLDYERANITERANTIIRSIIDELFTSYILYRSGVIKGIFTEEYDNKILSKFSKYHIHILENFKTLLVEYGATEDAYSNILCIMGRLLRTTLVDKFDIKTKDNVKNIQYTEDGDSDSNVVTTLVSESHPIIVTYTTYIGLAVAADLGINEFSGELYVINNEEKYNLTTEDLNDGIKSMFANPLCTNKFQIVLFTQCNQSFMVYDSYDTLGYYKAIRLPNSYL